MKTEDSQELAENCLEKEAFVKRSKNLFGSILNHLSKAKQKLDDDRHIVRLL